ncbi:hypothetical protein [Corallococcus sp. Z5C101001]|uniref:hypothetical protein n=1 Tax=Corallococcus sp. Z5C101001 TaxID=2596829 RepID=UPI00117D10D2|nr:hypothetical protein [Corallococcus sp. Z5C101001]TSC32859.1 hypothetical protein FOF48_07640 [Corallococcus sp. Z5C101001]
MMVISGFDPAAVPNAVGLFLFECECPLTAYQRSELLREMRERGWVRASAWGLTRAIDERRRWFGTGGWLPHLDVDHELRTRDLRALLERHRIARAWFVQTTTVYPAPRTVDPLPEPIEAVEPLGLVDDEAHVHVVVITERKWFTYGPGAKLRIERRRRITLGEYEDEGDVVFESNVRPESGYRYFLRDGVLVRQRLRVVDDDDDDEVDDSSSDVPPLDPSTPSPTPPACPFELSGYRELVERLPYEMETNGELAVEIRFASAPDEEQLEIVNAFFDLWAAQYPPGRRGPPWRDADISCKGRIVRFCLDRFAPPAGRADEHVDRLLAIMTHLHEHLPIATVSI